MPETSNEFTRRPSATGRPFSKQAAAILLLILIAGLGLRLYRLNDQSVWFDEAFSLTAANRPLGEMTATVVEDFVHPPLHYYLLHGVFRTLGFGDFQARLVSVVFGTLTIAVMFLLGRYVYDTAAGLIGALLMAVSQLAVMYSQEARPYAMAVFFTACSILCFVVALRERRRMAWAGFLLFGILMLYTHYYTVLILAGLLLYDVVARRNQPGIPVRWWMVWGAVLALAFLPWLASGVVGNALHSPRTIPAGQPPWILDQWSALIRDVNRFDNGAVDGLRAKVPWWSFAAGGLLFVWPVWLAVRRLASRATALPENRGDVRSTALLATLWLAPHLTLMILALKGVPYDVRYALACTVPYYLLAGRGITIMRSRIWRCASLAGILLYSGYALRADYFIPYKENYRDALGHIANAQQPGDCALFFPDGTLPLQWGVYHAGQTPPRIIRPEPETSDMEGCKRIWLVTYTKAAPPSGQLRSVHRNLTASFIEVERQHYFGVDVMLYARPPL